MTKSFKIKLAVVLVLFVALLGTAGILTFCESLQTTVKAASAGTYKIYSAFYIQVPDGWSTDADDWSGSVYVYTTTGSLVYSTTSAKFGLQSGSTVIESSAIKVNGFSYYSSGSSYLYFKVKATFTCSDGTLTLDDGSGGAVKFPYICWSASTTSYDSYALYTGSISSGEACQSKYAQYHNSYASSNCFLYLGEDNTTVTANVTKVTEPTQVSGSSYTYDGTTKSMPSAYSNSSYWTVSGTTTATNAGTYKVTLTPKDGYGWSDGSTSAITRTWTIAKQSISPTLSIDGFTYGANATPTVSGNTGGGTVKYYYNTENSTSGGTEWDGVSNIDAGTYYMYAVVGATTNYASATTETVEFTVEKASFVPTVTVTDFVYGSQVKPTISNNVSGGTEYICYVKSDTEPTGAFSKQSSKGIWGSSTVLSAGTYWVIGLVYATTNYNAAWTDVGATPEDGVYVYHKLVVSAKTLDGSAVADLSAQTYTGSALTPSLTVKDGDTELVEGTDYDVTYTNNTSAGTATVKVTYKGNYTGSATTTFTVKKADQSFELSGDSTLSVLDGKGKVTLSGSGSTYLSSGYSYSSSDESVVTVDANGNLVAGNKVGTATVTVTNPGNGNLNATTKTLTVTTTLESGFYVGDLDGDNTVYSTLQDAVDAAAKSGEAIHIKGNPTVDSAVEIPSNATINIEGDSGATLTRASGYTGAIFDVKDGGSLTLGDVTLDGEEVEGEALIVSAGDVTLGDGVTIQNGATSGNGGAVELSAGTLTVSDGATLKNNTASNGGAVYVGGTASIKLDGGEFTGNVASGNGGAIWISGSSSASAIGGGSIENNSAACGNGIYLDGSAVVSLDGSSNTEKIADSFGIGSTGTLDVGDTLDHKITIQFADPATQVDNTSHAYVTNSGKALSGSDLKKYFRVQNSGYTFNGTSGIDNSLTLAESSDEVARIVTTENGVEQVNIYYSLQQAVNAAASMGGVVTIQLVQYQNDYDTSLSTTEIEIADTLIISDGATVIFDSIVKHTDSTGSNYTYEKAETPTVLKRSASLADEMIRIKEDGGLFLSNVTLDGGAEWEGGSIQIEDDGKGGAGTVTTNNNGITAHAPVIVNAGILHIASGATIQNNDNNYATPGLGFGSQNYGGGIRNEGTGALTMVGGTIKNCYAREGGAIMNINKPGTDAYAEDTSPTVAIDGGEITGNVSQQKGAAVQTIYGGALTHIGDSANIHDNWSLNNLGTLSVEEGGILNVEGGTVAAGSGTDLSGNTVENTNAIYLYNKYSADDYAGATTKPFIEGKSVAQLTISGSPTLTGNVHVDDKIIVNGTETSDNPTVFEPCVDLTGYTGSGITLDLNDNAESALKAKAGDKTTLENVTVNGKSESGLKGTFTYIAAIDGNSSNGYGIYAGSYDLTVDQTEPGELVIGGSVDSGAESVTLTLGGKTFTLTKGTDSDGDGTNDIDADGNVSFTLDFAGNGLTDAEYSGVTIELGYDGASHTSTETTLAVVQFTRSTAELSVAEGTVYIDENGEEQKAVSGTLPNDIAIDENGYATFVVDGEERKIHLGVRAAEVDPKQSVLKDLSDTTLTVSAESGMEYNLLDEDGNIVTPATWQTVGADGNITFTGLVAGKTYTVVARGLVDENTIPGVYSECPDSTYSTLTEDEDTAKDAYEAAYAEIESKLSDGTSEPQATISEVEAVLEKYNAVSDVVKGLEFVEEQYQKLVPTYKILAKDEIANAAETAKTNGADGTSVEAIVSEYTEKINAATGSGADKTIGEELARAKAALELREHYDKLLETYGADMTDESKSSLSSALEAELKNIAAAETSEVADILSYGKTELSQIAAVGVLTQHYNEIVAAYEQSGISGDDAKAIVSAAFESGKDSIEGSELSDVDTALQSGILDLDRAEGKAVLTDYLEDDDTDTTKAVATAASENIDAAADKDSITQLVEAAKLDIEKSRAKQYIEDTLSENYSDDGKTEAAKYTDDGGIIDKQTTKDDVWKEAYRIGEILRIENAREYFNDRIASVENDPNADAKKAIVTEYLDAALTSINDSATDASKFEEIADEAIQTVDDKLNEYDRTRFTEDHQDILEKSVNAVTADDLEAIDAAIDDLAANYAVSSQENMQDLRLDLLEKKLGAASLVLEGYKDGTSVDSVVDAYIDKLDNIEPSGDIGEDAETNIDIDELLENAKLAIELEAYKNDQNSALETLKGESPSDELVAIVDGYKEQISAVAFDESKTLDEQKAIIDEIVKNANFDITEQQEKDDGKAALQSELTSADLQDDAISSLVTAAETEIQALEKGDSESDADFESRVQAIVDKYAVMTEIEQSKNTAQANLDSETANDSDEIKEIIAAAKTEIDEVSNELTSEEAQAAIDEIVANALAHVEEVRLKDEFLDWYKETNGKFYQRGSGLTSDELEAAEAWIEKVGSDLRDDLQEAIETEVADTNKAIELQKYVNDNKTAVEKSVSQVISTDETSIVGALNDYNSLSEEVRSESKVKSLREDLIAKLQEIYKDKAEDLKGTDASTELKQIISDGKNEMSATTITSDENGTSLQSKLSTILAQIESKATEQKQKDAGKTAIDGKLASGDSQDGTISSLVTAAKTEIQALNKGTSESDTAFESRVQAIVDKYAVRIEIEQYKNKKQAYLESLGVDDDSDEIAKLIEQANAQIDAVSNELTSAEAKELIDAITLQAESDIAVQKAKDAAKTAIDEFVAEQSITATDDRIGALIEELKQSIQAMEKNSGETDEDFAARVQEALQDAEDKLIAAQFRHDNPITEKSNDELSGSDAEDLNKASEAYGKLTDGQKAAVDALFDVEPNGYDDFENLVDTKDAAIAFNERKAEILEELEGKKKAHDGNLVTTVISEQIAEIENITFGEGGKSEEEIAAKNAELEDARDSALNEISLAQNKQQIVNQLNEELQTLLDSGKYSEEGKDELQKIFDEAKQKVESEPSDDGWNDLLDSDKQDTLQQFADVDVIAIVSGEVDPSDYSKAEYDSDYDYDENGYWGSVENANGMSSTVTLVIKKVGNDDAVNNAVNNASKNGDAVAAEGSNLSEEQLKAALSDKELKVTLDAYLMKDGQIITNFDGSYTVRVLLPESLRGVNDLQVIYLTDDGKIEVFETKVDGNYLIYTTTHFSEFLIIGEKTVNLLWIAILESIVLLAELVAIYIIYKTKKKDSAQKVACSAASLLLTLFLPNGIIPVIIVLGALAVGAAAFLLYMILRKN